MILCFATHKGGTGKTTSSINLASGLARSGKTTLLIDLDPQGHSSIGLGFELEYHEPNMADILLDHKSPMQEIVRPTHYPKLYLAPSNIRLASVAEAIYAKPKREERLSLSLRPLAKKYEWIVIDCPPALGVLTSNAVTAADAILIPCQVGARALDGLKDLLDLVSILKNEQFKEWWILETMVDKRNKLTLELFDEQLQPYREKKRLLSSQIFVNEALNQAQMARQDIFSFDPKSRGAQCYDALTQELLTIYR